MIRFSKENDRFWYSRPTYDFAGDVAWVIQRGNYGYMVYMVWRSDKPLKNSSSWNLQGSADTLNEAKDLARRLDADYDYQPINTADDHFKPYWLDLTDPY